jgi:hypothetical protein
METGSPSFSDIFPLAPEDALKVTDMLLDAGADLEAVPFPDRRRPCPTSR